MRARQTITTALLALSVLSSGPAAAQLPEEPAPHHGRASLTLGVDHGSRAAAPRLQAAGLLPVALAPAAVMTRERMAVYLRQAAAAAEGSALERIATGWLARFQEEFPETRAGEGASTALLGSAVGVWAGAERGRAEPGLAEYVPDRTGALDAPEPAPLAAGGELAARVGGRIGLSASPRVSADGAEIERWQVAVPLGSWLLAAGRDAVQYGETEGGSPVLSGRGKSDMVQVGTLEPFRLPSLLRYLGPVTFHTFLGRLDTPRHPGNPLLWGASGAVHPHPRVSLRVHRAALIGGDGVTDPVTAWTIAQALVGKHASIENQIVSVEGRFRLPTERWLPVTAYCEWGSEDSSGSFYRVPGLVCGGLAPVLPHLPAASAGVEVAYFGESCCGNPEWYRHRQFPGSWATEAGPLGHALGGQGHEIRAYSSVSPGSARLRAEAQSAWRRRGRENLFVPGREGDSFYVSAAAALRVGARGEVRLTADHETGDGWREQGVTISTRLLF